jgi:glycerophosphoryl diester phosphodiesterase
MTPKIYAHRGASAQAPENTIAAFKLAADQQADGIELDVTLSKDCQLVVIHDDSVDRTTNGTGEVSDLTLAELQALDAGQGEHIPTLEEVFAAVGKGLLVNIELKNVKLFSNSLPDQVAQFIKTHNLIGDVIISSFNPFYLQRFHRQCPQARIGLLTLPHMAKLWVWRFYHFDALHPYFKDVNRTLVEKVRKYGQQINTWTVDDPQEIKRLMMLGVDGIITNNPQRTREIMESMT